MRRHHVQVYYRRQNTDRFLRRAAVTTEAEERAACRNNAPLLVLHEGEPREVGFQMDDQWASRGGSTPPPEKQN